MAYKIKKKRKQSPAQLANLRPFRKNDGDKKDPRINRKGVPADAIAARKLALELAQEIVTIRENKKGRRVTRFEKLILLMLDSPYPADRKNIASILYPGILTEKIDHNVRHKIIRVGFGNIATDEDEADAEE